MNITARLIITLFVLSGNVTGIAQTGDLETQLQYINGEQVKAFAAGDTEKLLSYYDAGAVCMPEYHEILNDKNAIRLYFQQWFAATHSNRFKRTIYDLQFLENYLIEVGSFIQEFGKAARDSFTYAGKYLRVWKISKSRELKILSEIWGSAAYLDRSQLPSIGIIHNAAAPQNKISQKTEQEVNRRNQLITDLVKNRKGAEHATLFTRDAIYMPYYMPMRIGIDSITAYFSEHEKPGDVLIDSLKINASMMLDLGSLILEHGYYAVRWRAGNDSGFVKGKSINIWKRSEQGVLMLYRQMVNHD